MNFLFFNSRFPSFTSTGIFFRIILCQILFYEKPPVFLMFITKKERRAFFFFLFCTPLYAIIFYNPANFT